MDGHAHVPIKVATESCGNGLKLCCVIPTRTSTSRKTRSIHSPSEICSGNSTVGLGVSYRSPMVCNVSS